MVRMPAVSIEVLVRHRQAVQDAERTATRSCLVRARGVSHGAIGNEGDDRVDLRVDALDAREVRGHDIARGDVLASNARSQLDRAEIAQFVACSGPTSARAPLRRVRRRAVQPG